MLSAIENLENGFNPTNKVTILPLNMDAIKAGRQLLIDHGGQYNFNSNDAMIAGTMQAEQNRSGETMTMITSDKGLKAVLKAAGLSCFDPK